MITHDNLLPLAATARKLRVPQTWLKLEAEEGRLPGVRTGDGWLFHFPTIVRLLEERAIRGNRNLSSGGEATDA